MRIAFKTREDEHVEEREFKSASDIATHFGVSTAKVEQLCEWADEEQCQQGMALSLNESLIVEPHN